MVLVPTFPRRVCHRRLPSFTERAPGVWIPNGYRPGAFEEPTPTVHDADDAAVQYLRCARSLPYFVFAFCWSLHTDDPKVREAAIKSVEFMTNLYKEGVVPPEALSWNDADDNNGYQEKLFVMDFDGTLSTELAMIKDKQAFLPRHEGAGPGQQE